MKQLRQIMDREQKLVIGLMSGTSADGIDAALVRIDGYSLNTRVKQLGFVTLPFAPAVRERILALAGGETGGSHELCLMNFLLGKLSADACLAVCAQAGVTTGDVDLIGSHGQTLWHVPRPEEYLGHALTATYQIGEASVLNEVFDCPVVSDFRVRDIAAGRAGRASGAIYRIPAVSQRNPDHRTAKYRRYWQRDHSAQTRNPFRYLRL